MFLKLSFVAVGIVIISRNGDSISTTYSSSSSSSTCVFASGLSSKSAPTAMPVTELRFESYRGAPSTFMA
jgi:hypothetical protein